MRTAGESLKAGKTSRDDSTRTNREDVLRKKQALIQQLNVLTIKLNKTMGMDKRYDMQCDSLRKKKSNINL